MKLMKKNVIYGFFVLPTVILVAYTSLVPFLMNFYYSLFRWDGVSRSKEYVGLQNFVYIFQQDTQFLRAGLFTLRFTVVYVLLVNVLALAIALSIHKKSRLNSFVRAFYYTPYIISITAISLIWKFILGPGFNSLFNLTGLTSFNRSWTGSPDLIYYVIILVSIWQNVGFYVVIYIAGILNVPQDLLEAAVIDGAGKGKIIWNIVFPLIRPSIFICLLTSLTFSFKLFDIIMVFTRGGPANSSITLAYNIYKEAFTYSNYGLAMAKAIVFFLFVFLVSILQFKLIRQED